MSHISFSQLNMFLKCGEQYRQRYILKKIIPPSAALIRGKSCHKAEEINFKQKIETENDLSVEAVKDYFSDNWESEKFKIRWTEKDLDGDSVSKATSRVKDIGVGLIGIYHKNHAPLVIPISVEDKFSVQFEGGYPELIGYMDLIEKEDIISESKFVGKSPTKGEIDTDVQLTTYDLGFRQKYGRKPQKLIKRYAIATKTPKTDTQEAPARADDVIDRYLRRLEAFMSALEKGLFLPATSGSWWCSQNWCGYWQDCLYRP